MGNTRSIRTHESRRLRVLFGSVCICLCLASLALWRVYSIQQAELLRLMVSLDSAPCNSK